ncbi:DUF927 domain-containing protein [Photobacterium leiognathi]|uniref:DUF927 domain-containing protein n=1 Tax=Photobacterium leiognathi TaxID=553611 RepID=UPI0029816C76|nr:DUF927 domain-containing protein [Photobacterium leiognathi]
MTTNNVTPLKETASQQFTNSLPSLMPKGYQYDKEQGLIIHIEWKENSKGAAYSIETEICSPLAITALTHSEDGKEGGLLLKWIDRRNQLREWVLPQYLLAGGFETIATNLQKNLIKYLPTDPKARRLFMDYLQKSTPENWILFTERTGWHDGSFVFPDYVIGDKEIAFQSTNAKHQPPKITGDVKDWIEKIGCYCVGNPTLTLGACTAFASPLAGLLGENGFMCHLIGESSKGKTISLGVNCSVFGMPKGLWRGTDNAIESELEARSNIGNTFDELGQSTPKDAYQTVYMLGNGKGKARANKDGNAQRVRTFTLVALSTGEMSLNDFLSNGGKPITGGLSVRFIEGVSDQFKYGCFDNLHGMSDGGLFATYMENVTGIAGDTYKPLASGSVGIEFIKYIAKNIGGDIEVIAKLKARMKKITKALTPKDSDSQISRMANSMALLILSGELATKAGLTGWDKETAYNELSRWWFECVIPTRGGTNSTEKEKAFEQVKDFFELHHMSHFAPLGTTEDNKPVTHYGTNYGYVEELNGVTTFYVTAAGWKLITKGYNPKQVVTQLVDKNLLMPHGKDGRTQVPKKINGKTGRYYMISGEILSQ